MIQELVDVHRTEFSGLILRIPTTRASTKRKGLKILDPHAGRVVLGPMDTREKIRKLAELDGGHGTGGRSTKELQRIGGVAEALGDLARDRDLAPPCAIGSRRV